MIKRYFTPPSAFLRVLCHKKSNLDNISIWSFDPKYGFTPTIFQIHIIVIEFKTFEYI